MRVNDWLYVNTSDNKARFVLGVQGDNPLICIGINPSIATPDKFDPAMKWLQKFANNKNFDSYIMLNVYPQRITNPQGIDDQCNDNLHRENIRQIKKVIKKVSGRGKLTILAIWGVSIEVRLWLRDCLYDIIEEIQVTSDCDWKCLGLLKGGHPRYHRGIKSTAKYQDFDIKTYKENVLK